MFGLFVVGVVLSNVQKECWDVVWDGYDTIFTFVNVFCIYSLCTKYVGKENWFRKIISAVSGNTLGIYFIHMSIIPIVGMLVYSVWFLGNVPGNLIFAALVLLASLGVVLGIKKVPLLKMLVQ